MHGLHQYSDCRGCPIIDFQIAFQFFFTCISSNSVMQTNYMMNTYTQVVFFVSIYMELSLTSACGTARAIKASRYAQSIMGTECSNNHNGSELCSGVARDSPSPPPMVRRTTLVRSWGGGGTIIPISSVDQ
jgi:hypothetical protein